MTKRGYLRSTRDVQKHYFESFKRKGETLARQRLPLFQEPYHYKFLFLNHDV